jgi:hypothetical protein
MVSPNNTNVSVPSNDNWVIELNVSASVINDDFDIDVFISGVIDFFDENGFDVIMPGNTPDDRWLVEAIDLKALEILDFIQHYLEYFTTYSHTYETSIKFIRCFGTSPTPTPPQNHFVLIEV